jgi:hypothetical protein
MVLGLEAYINFAPRLVAEDSLHHIAFVGVGTGKFWGLSRSTLQGATNAGYLVMLKQAICEEKSGDSVRTWVWTLPTV